MRTWHQPPIPPRGTTATSSHSATLAACLRCARRNLREQAWRVRLLQPGRREVELTSTKFALFHHGTRRQSHRGTCSRRVTRLSALPCPLPSSVPLPPLGLTGDRVCGASRAGYDRSFSLGGGSPWYGQRSPTRRRRLVPRLAPRHHDTTPCRSTLDGFWAARRLQASRASALALGFDRQRQERGQQPAVAGVRLRSTRSRVPRMPADAMHSAGPCVCLRQDSPPGPLAHTTVARALVRSGCVRRRACCAYPMCAPRQCSLHVEVRQSVLFIVIFHIR